MSSGLDGVGLILATILLRVSVKGRIEMRSSLSILIESTTVDGASLVCTAFNLRSCKYCCFSCCRALRVEGGWLWGLVT